MSSNTVEFGDTSHSIEDRLRDAEQRLERLERGFDPRWWPGLERPPMPYEYRPPWWQVPPIITC